MRARFDRFEDAVRNAVSLGGDADTLAVIAGPIAEAMHCVPGELVAAVKEGYLSGAPDIIEVIERKAQGALPC